MRRNGLGSSPVVLRRKKSVFPRRGLGQDTSDADFLGSNGISLSDYELDQQPDVYSSTPSSSPTNVAALLTPILAATPAIETGAAQIIKAQNTPGIAVSGVVGGTSTGVGTTTGSGSGLLLLLLLGVAAVAVMGKG